MADSEDDFSDDDFDTLPTETLAELEQTALTQHDATQLNTPAAQQQFHQTYQTAQQNFQQTYQTLPTLPSTRAQTTGYPGNNTRFQTATRYARDEHPSSDYGNFDAEALQAEVLDALELTATFQHEEQPLRSKTYSGASQSEQWRRSRYSHSTKPAPPGWSAGQAGISGDVEMRDNLTDGEEADAESKTAEKMLEEHNTAVSELQAKIEELKRERDALQETVETVKSSVIEKTGEVAIVRANQQKTIKEYERKMTAMQKLHADEVAKKKAEVGAALAEKERVATENTFLKRELTEESEKVKNMVKSMGKTAKCRDFDSIAGMMAVVKPATPKKGKGPSYRDGFDDDEIMMSPTKILLGRSKPATPKAANKRKRKGLDDSPGLPLRLTQDIQPNLVEEESVEQEVKVDSNFLESIGKEDGRYQFLQTILNHRPHQTHSRTMEAFIKYAFPSAPENSLMSLICDDIPLLAVKLEPEAFATGFCLILLPLWQRCLDEKFFGPIRLIVNLLCFVLTLYTTAVTPHLIDTLLPLAQSTVDINAMERFKRTDPSKIKPEIDVSACMSLLNLAAAGCFRSEADITRFWRLMRFDFILMMLNQNQPIEHIHLVLDLLSTSAQHGTLGPITTNKDDDQKMNESHVLNRISGLLLEYPKPPDGEEPYDSLEILDLKIDVLELLGIISSTEEGGKSVLLQASTVTRLVKTMDDELEDIYDYRSGVEQRARIVNTATRLLHHLLTTYPGLINLEAKLMSNPFGINHKFIVTLTRLAFSEGLVLEQGIDDDVAECAMELLEFRISPEESDALTEVMTRPRGDRSVMGGSLAGGSLAQ